LGEDHDLRPNYCAEFVQMRRAAYAEDFGLATFKTLKHVDGVDADGLNGIAAFHAKHGQRIGKPVFRVCVSSLCSEPVFQVCARTKQKHKNQKGNI
jgi:hypothetical protein